MTLLPAFLAALEGDSSDALEGALIAFCKLPEVKANGKIEIGFLLRTIKPLGLGIGERLAQATAKPRERWLKRLATHEKAAVRCLACYVLGELGKVGPTGIIATAHKLAADDRWEVRECIANAFDDQIGLAQPEFAYELMRQWVTDPSPNVRRCTTNALMRYGIIHPKRVITLMEQLRHDESEYVRKNVAFCLQQIAKEKHPILGKGHADNPDVMLTTLKYWIKDTNHHNRWIVATTLGNVWAKQRLEPAFELLHTLAADEDRLVRNAAASSLRDLAKYGPEEARAAAQAWATDSNETVRLVGEKVLKKLS
jgi:3-methyladenine DNA glycosylase AlkC